MSKAMDNARRFITATRSTCSACRQLVDAKVLDTGTGIVMEKFCPTHGMSSVPLGPDRAYCLDASRFHRAGSVPHSFARQVSRGCPHDCGLCPEHEQHVCTPIIEITDHCDLACPVCLVENRHAWHMSVDELDRMLDRLITAEGSIDVLNLSGGEPTLHPHFREFVDRCLARSEVARVTVSTNGLRLAEDESLARFLTERNVVVSLQYDGPDNAVYQALRGRPLLEVKERVIARSVRMDAPLSLTMTVAGGLNDTHIADAVGLLFSHANILSLMIQPASFTGRAARMNRAGVRRISIPEVLDALARVRDPRVSLSREDFSPLPCSHPLCFALGFFLKTGDGEFQSIKRLVDTDRFLTMVTNRPLFGLDPESFQSVRDAVHDLWSGPAGTAPDSVRALRAVRRLMEEVTNRACGCSGRAVMGVAERSIKSIFIHQFMDAETFDLSRVRKCCTVYPQPDGACIPLCVRNVLHLPPPS